MNEEEKNRLGEIREQLLELTTSPEALEGLAPEERASLLMFQLRSSEKPSMQQFEMLLKTLHDIPDQSTKIDIALDLMGQIDITTGNIDDNELEPEVQDVEPSDSVQESN